MWHQFSYNVTGNKLDKGIEQYWSVERDPISRQTYYIYKGVGDRERFSRPGWYELFDGDRGRPYYALLGEFGWETVTWKKPHESSGRISRGSADKSISIVVWNKPKIESRIANSKMEYLQERLHDLDMIMDHLQNQANDGVELPHFSIFHDIIGEIVRISMSGGSNSHTLLSLNLDEHSETIRKEITRRILSMPRVKGDKLEKFEEGSNGQRSVVDIYGTRET